MKIRDWIAFLDKDASPLRVRELILAYVCYALPTNLVIGRAFSSLAMRSIVFDTSSTLFLSSLIYSVIISVSTARMIESGSLAWLMTMPFHRKRFLYARQLFQLLTAQVAFSIPTVLFFFYETFYLNYYQLAIMETLLFGTLLLYISLGNLVASIVRTPLASLGIMLALLYFLTEYVSRLFAANFGVRTTLFGVYNLAFVQPSYSQILYVTLSEASLGIGFIFLYIFVLRLVNLRGGK
ncbi:MAG: hypothetical protein ACYDAZ_06000 [Thermoplasmataceae archaeon]